MPPETITAVIPTAMIAKKLEFVAISSNVSGLRKLLTWCPVRMSAWEPPKNVRITPSARMMSTSPASLVPSSRLITKPSPVAGCEPSRCVLYCRRELQLCAGLDRRAHEPCVAPRRQPCLELVLRLAQRDDGASEPGPCQLRAGGSALQAGSDQRVDRLT